MRRFLAITPTLCLFSAGVLAAERPYPRTVMDDRPVAYWRFEEPATEQKVANLGSQETALDGRRVDVVLTKESATAALGQAAIWDRATSRVELAGPVSRWLNGTASLEFWIKTTQRGEGSWNAPALFGADSNGDGNDLFWGTNDGGRVGVRRGDSGPAALTRKPIDDNHWHHIVLVRDAASGQMKAYLDGRLAETYDDRQPPAVRTEYRTIGKLESLPGEGAPLSATIDEVAIYDYVLAPCQVKSHWKAAHRR